MLSSLSKLYLAAAAAAFLAFVVYVGIAGYDRTGAFLLVSLTLASLLAAFAASAATTVDVTRDSPADAPVNRQPVGDPTPAATRPSWWPLVAGAAVVAAVLGVAFGGLALVVAALLGAAALVGWVGQSFNEHPLHSAKLGDRTADRLSRPVLLPVLALMVAALVILAVSRIYLGVGSTLAVILSGVLAVVFFAGCALLAGGRKVPGAALAVIAVAVAVALVAAGALSTVLAPAHHEQAATNYTDVTIITQGTAYKEKRMELPAGQIRLTLQNLDPKNTFHNVGFYELKDPKSQVPGTPYGALPAVDGGQTGHFRFNTADFHLEKGKTYQFRCDFHPAMVGEVDIVDGPPAQVNAGGHG